MGEFGKGPGDEKLFEWKTGQSFQQESGSLVGGDTLKKMETGTVVGGDYLKKPEPEVWGSMEELNESMEKLKALLKEASQGELAERVVMLAVQSGTVRELIAEFSKSPEERAKKYEWTIGKSVGGKQE